MADAGLASFAPASDAAERDNRVVNGCVFMERSGGPRGTPAGLRHYARPRFTR